MQKAKPKKLRMRSGKFIALTALPMALVLLLSIALTVASTALASTLDTYLGRGKPLRSSRQVPRIGTLHITPPLQ